MHKHLLRAAMAFGLLASAATADSTRAITAKSGVATEAGTASSVFPDCTNGPLPELSKMPEHGTVEIRPVNKEITSATSKCKGKIVRTGVAFYTSAADYKGADSFAMRVLLVKGKDKVPVVSTYDIKVE